MSCKETKISRSAHDKTVIPKDNLRHDRGWRIRQVPNLQMADASKKDPLELSDSQGNEVILDDDQRVCRQKNQLLFL